MLTHSLPPLCPPWQLDFSQKEPVVVGTTLELTRNIVDLPFPARLPEDRWLELRHRVEDAFASLEREFHLLDGEALAPTVVAALRGWRVFGSREKSPLSVVSPDYRVVVQIGESDHLRLTIHSGGSDPTTALTELQKLDAELEGLLHYAVSLRLGYLSPTIDAVGPGFTVGGTLFLPALHRAGAVVPVEPREPGGIHRSVPAAIITPLSIGESAADSLYQVTVSATPRETEEETLAKLADAVQRLVHYEQQTRGVLLRDHGEDVQDAAYRAWGTLTQARRLDRAEVDQSASLLGLAVASGVADVTTAERAVSLLLYSSDAVVAALAGETTSLREGRAQVVRRQLKMTQENRDV